MQKTIFKLALATFITSILFTLVAITASAASSGTCGDNLTWTLDDNGTLTISGEGEMNSHPWSSLSSQITAVKIENGVTTIAAYAFSSCQFLREIEIPNSITSIDELAFLACYNLRSIIIPDSVSSIGKGVLEKCTSLTSLTVPFVGSSNNQSKNIGYIFSSGSYASNSSVPSSLKTVNITSAKHIDDEAFQICHNIKNITIGNSVTSIGESAFAGSGLTTISIGNSVASIGSYAFSNCHNLTDITIPKSVTSIGGYAFNSCDNLTNVKIQPGVTSIDDTAFVLCTALTNITIPDTVTNIGNSAFANCTSLANITIPDSVTNIGKNAFYNCTKLSNIIIPNSVTTIGAEAFKCCTSLKKISLPFIGSSREVNGTSDALFGYIFGNDTGIETTQYYSATSSVIYKIPSSLKSVTITDANIIPYGAFYGCNSLDNITLNSGVNTIYSNAFYNCSNLMDITIMSQSLKTPNSNIFTGCDMLTIHGIEDSDIEEYATKYELDFESIDESTEVTASAEVIEGNIVITAKANASTAGKFIPVAVYDKDNVMLDLIIIPTNEDFNVLKIVFKDIKNATFAKMFMWNSYNDLVPLDTAKEVTIVRK